VKNGSVLPSPRHEGRVTTMQQAITTNTLFTATILPSCASTSPMSP
jgi:hypothetical protein